MDMKKKLLLSMILLALCLIQASADTYYFKIQLSTADGKPGGWSKYIKVEAVPDGVDGNGKTKYKYPNGLRTLLNGGAVTVEDNENPKNTYTLPKNDKNEAVLDRIYGIAFANGNGKDNDAEQQNIMEGDEYEAWKLIRTRIKYLGLGDYKRDSYTNDSYFMYMDNVEELELPKGGMNVGDGDKGNGCIRYFANAWNLKRITICIDGNDAPVDITAEEAKDKVLLNRVGKFMFSNCYSLSTKYINRLIKNVTEIKDNAFYVDKDHRGNFSDEPDHKMAIEIPSSVTKIGDQAFWNRVKVTGLNIQGNTPLEIGSEAFRGCEQLNTFEGDKAKITKLGTGVFGDCRSMTNEFVNGVLKNYADNYAVNADNKEKKIPAYLFFGCNGQDGHDVHDESDKNKKVCTFTDLNIPAQFTEIGDGAFASTGDAVIKLKTITVNRGEAPKCLQGETDEYATIKNKRVFDGLDPNMTTVIFAGDAEGWNESETTGFLTYMNDGSEFQRLLTKDLKSEDEEYKNVPQQHAIVRLHRKLKVGWNTICLPFGVNYRYCSSWGENYKKKQAYNTRIIVNGLTNNNPDANDANSGDFTMGVYRGYWREGKTFMFLHYTGFDDYPLNLCETFLVKMRPQDIAKNDTYTFRNVDLNYRWSADGKSGNEGKWTLVKAYTADEMLNLVKDFDGSVNTNEIPFDKASYDDYVLRGSLVQRTGTVGDSQVGITTKDYFFQQSKNGTMKLYPYTEGNKYGIRGFSGWFHKINNSTTNAHELSLSLFDDSCTTPIETVKVDDLNRDTSGKVYSISGVLMKNNAADLNNLPKGIYVVNGKKYVVK